MMEALASCQRVRVETIFDVGSGRFPFRHETHAVLFSLLYHPDTVYRSSYINYLSTCCAAKCNESTISLVSLLFAQPQKINCCNQSAEGMSQQLHLHSNQATRPKSERCSIDMDLMDTGQPALAIFNQHATQLYQLALTKPPRGRNLNRLIGRRLNIKSNYLVREDNALFSA